MKIIKVSYVERSPTASPATRLGPLRAAKRSRAGGSRRIHV